MGGPAPRQSKRDHNDIEIDEDPGFQRLVWRFERVGWSVIAVLLAAALAGLFGEGPLSHATADASGVHIEYDRFLHYDTRSVLRLSVARDRTAAGELRVRLPHHYLKAIELEQITPPPESAIAATDGQIFVFRAPAGVSAMITFSVRPVERGLIRTEIDVEGAAAPLAFWQFTYP